MNSLDQNQQVSETIVKIQPRHNAYPTAVLLPPQKIGAETASRKRKLELSTFDDLWNNTFSLERQPYPVSSTVRSLVLNPLLLLPRSCLPLSYLDLSSTVKLLGSRLFKAHIKILESEELSEVQPITLIAREEGSKSVIALEREFRGIYAVCQIGSWVNFQRLKDAAVASKDSLLMNNDCPDPSPSKVRSTKPKVRNHNQEKKREAIEAIQSMVKRHCTIPDSKPSLQRIDAKPSLIEIESSPYLKSTYPDPEGSTLLPASPTGVFENIRAQYFETLYFSKMSPAYFVKGPLSRARAVVFHSDTTCPHVLNDYRKSLLSLVLPIMIIDKKYKEGLPECTKMVESLEQDIDDVDKRQVKKGKKKKPRDLRPGKTGLYSAEKIFIQKWWMVNDDEDNINLGLPGRTKQDIDKTRISQLRIRETQLQIILILEVLTLQSLSITKENGSSEQASSLSNESKKSRKSIIPNDLINLIDVHIDRLCIWQSVTLESLEDTSKKSENVIEARKKIFPQAKRAENFLRDFCVEIIVPFFASRLPTECEVINRKLGVPIANSPKSKLSKHARTSGLSRPGAATKRTLPGNPHASLRRALTDDRKRRSVSQSHSKAISLMKSATMPLISTVKKPGSDALSSQYFLQSLSQRSASFAITRSDTNSKNKTSCIDIGSENLTSALNKSCRELNTKDTVQPFGKFTASSPNFERTQVSFENRSSKGVQIIATPKANRNKVVTNKPLHLCYPSAKILPNSPSIISSSSLQVRPLQLQSNFADEASPFSSVLATPSRESVFSKPKHARNPYSSDEEDICSSPLFSRRSSDKLFKSVSRSAAINLDELTGVTDTAKTPIKSVVEKIICKSPSFYPGIKENLFQASSTTLEDRSIL